MMSKNSPEVLRYIALNGDMDSRSALAAHMTDEIAEDSPDIIMFLSHNFGAPHYTVYPLRELAGNITVNIIRDSPDVIDRLLRDDDKFIREVLAKSVNGEMAEACPELLRYLYTYVDSCNIMMGKIQKLPSDDPLVVLWNEAKDSEERRRSEAIPPLRSISPPGLRQQ